MAKTKDELIEALVASLRDLVGDDDEKCRFDHYGDCQEHSWFGIKGKCPVQIARDLLTEVENAKEST